MPRWARLYRAAASANLLTLLIGLFAAAAHQRFAAYLLIAYVVVQICSHIGLGLFGYRAAMGRQWPSVTPPPKDADDW